MTRSKIILSHKIFTEYSYNIINKNVISLKQKFIYGEQIDFPLHLQSINSSWLIW
jgi:hypothetical protein